MPRCLIIGCGCRGTSLTRDLVARGHVVRGTTRNPARAVEIEAAGGEAVVADPDRVATLAAALEHVVVACLLLGSVSGDESRVAELHGPRLDMLLARMLDSTVRGIVYEATGTVNPELLERGAERVRAFCQGSMVPYAILDAEPADHGAWLTAAVAAVDQVLA